MTYDDPVVMTVMVGMALIVLAGATVLAIFNYRRYRKYHRIWLDASRLNALMQAKHFLVVAGEYDLASRVREMEEDERDHTYPNAPRPPWEKIGREGFEQDAKNIRGDFPI